MADIHPNDLATFTAFVIIDRASAVMIRAIKLIIHHDKIMFAVGHFDHP
jgi:hypothetical protein